MVAIDIFTNKKLEDICPSTHNMDVPVVKKREYQLLSIEDNFVSLMDLETCDTKDDLRLPDGELGEQIKQAFEKEQDNGILLSVTAACGEEMILGFKSAPNK
jgi:translation initiation factor 5A